MNLILKLLLLSILLNFQLFSKELITPIPEKISYNKEKAILGEKLFFDTRLSGNNTISCASCHDIYNGGDDNLKVSLGVNEKKGKRNAPTVYNSVFNTSQFWDARVSNLTEQAKFPINNPLEMNSNFQQILEKLNEDKFYVEKFYKIYRERITEENIIESIVEYEKTLITPNSKFDKYLKGDKSALNKDELAGFNSFKDYGCISCHNGVNIGGNIVQKIGVISEFNSNDLGVYEITKKDQDKFYFKVPSLRNVELTAPYFHDGSVKTLKEAVNLMAIYQIGFPISEKDSENIVKFLKTLTGEMPLEIK